MATARSLTLVSKSDGGGGKDNPTEGTGGGSGGGSGEGERNGKKGDGGGSKVPITPSSQTADPGDFYVPSPGKDGIVIGSRVAPELKQQIQEVVQSGIFHYKTESDFVRAACSFYMTERVAPRMNKRFQQDVRLMAHHTRTAQMLKRSADVEKYVEDTKEALLKLAQSSMNDEIVELYLEAVSTAKRIGPTFHALVKKRLEASGELKAIRDLVKARNV